MKIFKRHIEPCDYHNIKENLKRESDIIMYPKSKVFLYDEKTTFKGYLCNRAPGMDLTNFILSIADGKTDILFDDFLTGYYDKFLPELKKENVLLSDIKLEHIYFDDCFYLIDTDWYTNRTKDMTIEEKDEKNISRINTYLNNFIFAFLNIEVCNNLFFDISTEEKYKDEYIEKIFEGIKKATNGSVVSFSELLNYKFSYSDRVKYKHLK